MTLQPFPSIDHEPEDLLAWLQKAERSQIVGEPNASGDCPASRWLRNTHRSKDAAVTVEAVWIEGVGYETPLWLADFQRGIDALGKQITARRAVTVLTNVLAAHSVRRAA